MMTEDTNKVALVTGANKGIGYEVARQLGELSMYVLVGARDKQRGEEAAAKLRSQGIEAEHISLDVTDAESIKNAANYIKKEFGELNILVNNAGISGGNIAIPPSKTDMNIVRQVYEMNVFGTASVTIAMIPLLRKASYARIVNVSSSLGSINLALDPNDMFYGLNSLQYQSSKTALNAITVEFAKELESDNIKVNAACPGFVDTDFNGHQGTKSAEQAATIIVKLATLAEDGPTATFQNEDGELPW